MPYNLNTLTAFPHELIYFFSPESTAERLYENSNKIKDVLYPESMQYVDMLEAYLYAQNEILPQIQIRGLIAITPEQWIDFIKNIHMRIGHQIVKSFNGEAGKYADRAALRWHASTLLYNDLVTFIAKGGLNQSVRVRRAFCVELSEKYSQPSSDFYDFIHLLETIGNSSIRLTPAQEALLAPPGNPVRHVVTMVNKLYNAYSSGKLTSNQLTCLNKVAKVPIFQQIPVKMNEYAARLQNRLLSINNQDIDAISTFLSSTFYELTDIHPFLNANGRTATCFMNTLLVAMNQPAILLRYPSDRQNSTNAYSIAMATIDTNRAPLSALIKQRLIDAKEKPPYQDLLEKSIIEQRVQLSLLYGEIFAKNPMFDADAFQKKGITDAAHDPSMELSNISMRTHREIQTHKTLLTFKFIIQRLNEQKEALMTPQPTPLSLHSLLAAPRINPAKAKLMNALRVLTEENDWKIPSKNGVMTAWLPCEENRAKADKIVTTLREAGFCRANTKQIEPKEGESESQYVVLVTDIQLEILDQLQASFSARVSMI